MDLSKNQKVFDSVVVDQKGLEYRGEPSFDFQMSPTLIFVVLMVIIFAGLGAVAVKKSKDGNDTKPE